MKQSKRVVLLFLFAPLAGGGSTWLILGNFPSGVFFVTFMLLGALLWKPDRIIDWLDSDLKKEPR